MLLLGHGETALLLGKMAVLMGGLGPNHMKKKRLRHKSVSAKICDRNLDIGFACGVG